VGTAVFKVLVGGASRWGWWGFIGESPPSHCMLKMPWSGWLVVMRTIFIYYIPPSLLTGVQKDVVYLIRSFSSLLKKFRDMLVVDTYLFQCGSAMRRSIQKRRPPRRQRRRKARSPMPKSTLFLRPSTFRPLMGARSRRRLTDTDAQRERETERWCAVCCYGRWRRCWHELLPYCTVHLFARYVRFIRCSASYASARWAVWQLQSKVAQIRVHNNLSTMTLNLILTPWSYP